MLIEERCPNCSETMHTHMEEIGIHHPRYIRGHVDRYMGWYECVSCQRMYVPVVLKRFKRSHIVEGG